MNERQGKTDVGDAALRDALYQQITSASGEAIKVAFGLVDEADNAAQKMVAECETLLAAVKEGTEQIRGELRQKMVEFATVMREYSEEIAAKNRAYVEAAHNTADMINSHIEAVRTAMKAVAREGAPTTPPHAAFGLVAVSRP
jgi:alkanesulfonate monooxygenase SsuD/methylene tetrahydromethanopterin reductase-like flavin-dependent oxidoreductase (luciferase family)